jgi:hypothetical protein
VSYRNGGTTEPNLGGASFQTLVEANCRQDLSKDKKSRRRSGPGG